MKIAHCCAFVDLLFSQVRFPGRETSKVCFVSRAKLLGWHKNRPDTTNTLWPINMYYKLIYMGIHVVSLSICNNLLKTLEMSQLLLVELCIEPAASVKLL